MSDKSLGQIVDEIADMYFEKGMDGYSAGKAALVFVLRTLNTFEDFIGNRFSQFFKGDQS